MSRAVDALTAATVALGDGSSVRFALVLRPTQDPVALARAVAAELGPLAARVGPLSVLESRVLVADLPGRVLGPDTAAAFAAAYVLQDEFVLAAAEPDLPTGFFPTQPPPRTGSGLLPESVDGFPPGCWAPEQPELDARWALAAMRVPEAWAFSETLQRPSRGAGVVIAQPDTGITRHPELDGVAIAGGFDILDDDPDPTDPLGGFGNPGHGTGTASVAVSGETLVVWGTAPRARHMPIRAVESVIRVTQISVARAIDWAVAHGAQVITMSLGGIPSFSLQHALRRAVDADVIVLAAAGNCVRTVVWPARYDDCIAVAGTNAQDAPWRGTCRGAAVDISAPGENVLRASATPGGPASGQGQGTSFAVALTAGVAALWLAHHGRANLVAAARARGETLQRMFRRLVRASARRPAGWSVFEMGAGIVDAAALLAADLDLGRNLESVQPAADPRERAASSVRSLVAETAGPDAAHDDVVDWYAFGPEIAAAVLRGRLADLRTDAFRAEASPPPTAFSDRLAGSIENSDLRDWLGLDKIDGLDRETP